MNSPEDTIAAIATPAGQGGIGIVRISGPGALKIADVIFLPRKTGHKASGGQSHSVTYGDLLDPADGSVVDEVLVTVMRGPRSYTREDIVEINSHGGMVIVRRILEVVVAAGARLAEPGEFTKRAFLNGRIDLTQAEAVMDLISARTEEARRIAVEQLRGGLAGRLDTIRNSLIEVSALIEAYIDFPEEGIEAGTSAQLLDSLDSLHRELLQLSKTYDEARFFREGLSVAIVGRPNVGKSSLLNSLLQQDRAIVTDIPGTTRDLIEECLNLDGLPVRIIDTAGIRHSGETVEREGIQRSLRALEAADCILAVFDGSMPLVPEDHDLLARIRDRNFILVINKTDLPWKTSSCDLTDCRRPSVRVSTITGEGLDFLKALIVTTNLRDWQAGREGVVITNLRQKQALERSAEGLCRTAAALRLGRPLEIVSLELRDAIEGIGELTGAITPEAILDKIFSEFCIGK